jgi:hypothetical protein
MKVIEVGEGAYFVRGNWGQTLTAPDPSYSNQIVAEPDLTDIKLDDPLLDDEEDELPEGRWA